jgi:Rrf2 family iron-sulfur cluster assembly transcriptional regulator
MRLSLQVHYAICGIFDLAYNGEREFVRVGEIGERQGIPTRYLEQIFQRLRRAELIVGKRGPGGGYALARSPSHINLCEVVEAVEGPLRDAEAWAEVSAEAAPNRPDFLWPELADGFARVLSDTTLEQLCVRAAQSAVRRSNAAAYTYQI